MRGGGAGVVVGVAEGVGVAVGVDGTLVVGVTEGCGDEVGDGVAGPGEAADGAVETGPVAVGG